MGASQSSISPATNTPGRSRSISPAFSRWLAEQGAFQPGPDTAVGGSDITVTWSPTVAEADYINIVPFGTDADVFGSYVRIGKSTEVSIVSPGEEGLYEVRYLHNQTKEVLGQEAA